MDNTTRKYIADMLYLEKELTTRIHQHIDAYLRGYDEPGDVYRVLEGVISEARRLDARPPRAPGEDIYG